MQAGLKYSKVGGVVLIRREHLDEYLAGFTVGDGSDIDRLVDDVLEGF